MQKIVLFLIVIVLIFIFFVVLKSRAKVGEVVSKERRQDLEKFIQEKQLNSSVSIFVNYGLHSGRNRMEVWDLEQDTLIFACPVAHGRGRKLLGAKQFSNENNSWLSSLGKGVVAERYYGGFGLAYRLDGLDSTNSNIRMRYIVLHGYWSVPTRATFPIPSGRSKGCLMVSYKNMEILDEILKDKQQVVFYTYCDKER